MKLKQNYIENLVQKGTAHIKTATTHTPSNGVVDAPLLGNGDMGAAIKTEKDGFCWLLGKNDFWRQTNLYETQSQREERLLTQEGRRTGCRIITVGWLRLAFAELENNSFEIEQRPYNATVQGNVKWKDGSLRIKSWICAVQNTLVIEIENCSAVKSSVKFTTMAGMYSTREVDSYENGCEEDSVWFTYAAQPGNIQGRRHVAAAVVADVPAVYFPQEMCDKGGEASLPPNKTVKIYLSLLSDLDNQNPKQTALTLSREAISGYDKLWQSHTEWWHDYWDKSAVETGDELLDTFYYASLYLLGSCTRENKVPPALYGCWVTDDFVRWSGAYTINYNYQSPFFCLYPSNRQDIARSYLDPLLDIIPIGELYAREKYGRPGISLPVEIGPWGMVCSSIFHNQKTNAAYCCTNIFMHFFSTYDEEWGKRAYPFVKKTAEFWEADLVYENGVYNVIGDSAHEEYFINDGEKNNIHALGLLKMLFNGLLKMSIELNFDEDKRALWECIYDKLAPFPQMMRNNEPVFKYNEDKYEWREENGTPVKFIYPFGCLGLDSDENTLQIARNTLNQRQNLFHNQNAFCEYAAMRARVGCDPSKSYQSLIDTCLQNSYPNHYIYHGGGGIEDFSGVPNSIHEMMLQSHEGVIRVFPCWPADKNARFTRLRAYGAFLVSSQICQNEIVNIEILSEKGKELNLVLPWTETEIIYNDNSLGKKRCQRIKMKTNPGDVFVFCKASDKN